MRKKTLITLQRQCDGKLFEFELSHAERILNISNCGWIICDKKYEFDNGNIIRRSDTGENQES